MSSGLAIGRIEICSVPSALRRVISWKRGALVAVATGGAPGAALVRGPPARSSEAGLAGPVWPINTGAEAPLV